MHRDQYGLEMTAASAAAVRFYDETLLHFLGLREDTGERLKEVFDADPEMPMAHCARGYFMKLFCTPPLERKAEESLVAAERVSGAGICDREARHIAALDAWCQGDVLGATGILEDILLDYPHDVLALRLAHFTHFYLGDSAALRDSVARVLPFWGDNLPGYGFVLGVNAFGLEEGGAYDEAERTGRLAVEYNPQDIWATHAVAHVMEMQGRHRDGLEWLDGLSANWRGCNNFRYHAWWHKCLFHLELEEFDAILDLYDGEVRADTESADYLDMSNAVALLWRLEEAGADVGDRWTELADKSEDKIDDHIFVFHDAHYMMALARGDRREKADAMLDSMERAAARRDTTEGPIFQQVGLPLCRAIAAYGRADFAMVVDLLAPVRREVYRIGGSHAQRDLFFRLLLSAALKAGRYSFARALAVERNARNPRSVWGQKREAEAWDGIGDAAKASAARDRAAALLAG
ncbi:MAG: tetratricopeptide repeat protein [Pseudomonadota bacterium]